MTIDSNVIEIKISGSDVERIEQYGKVLWSKPEPEPTIDYFYIKNEYGGNNKFTFNYTSTYLTSANTEYKLNEGEWTKFTFGKSTTITIPKGGFLYLRGTDWVKKGTQGYFTESTQKFSVGGCILSLLNYSEIETIKVIPSYFAFALFQMNQNLVSANFNIGNAVEVEEYAFAHCFSGCTSLTTAPNFSNINKIGNSSFIYCFNGCTSLKTTPNFSKVLSVGSDGFEYCFRDCTSLTTAPNFSNITNIGLYAFRYCFQRCSSLNYIYAPSDTEDKWISTKFTKWVDGVASEGTFVKKSSTTIPTNSTSGIPSGWTVVNI